MLIFLNVEKPINLGDIIIEENTLISLLQSNVININNLFFCKTDEIRCILLHKKDEQIESEHKNIKVKCIFIFDNELISSTFSINKIEEIYNLNNILTTSVNWVKCKTDTDIFFINTRYLKSITISKIEYSVQPEKDDTLKKENITTKEEEKINENV